MDTTLLTVTPVRPIRAMQYNGSNWAQARSFAARYASTEIMLNLKADSDLVANIADGTLTIPKGNYIVAYGKWDLRTYTPEEFTKNFAGQPSGQNDLLNVEMDNDRIVMSIGIEAMRMSIESGQADFSVGGAVHIQDTHIFGLEMVDYLKVEAEDGGTPIHRMLDAVALEALDGGAHGIMVLDEDDLTVDH
ncbi:hypothetical protein F862_gp003 [Vibrio phage vB_VpaS_MAR10]|uniref:Uncharacterized protein n=1 Tax=Vibrio phage vB_VpaS_MAR10 TaxID=1229755 RepID=K7R9B7_9CAUD|nr:hypothetical protein F862_gp003 [Vibrio phage vB_VpaS_MAR10]AFV81243.1 hypothetical protein MAR10_011 [Vibrio phage vB_VpaS_MAR10]